MHKQEKCSASQIGRIVINNGSEERRVYENELPYYLSNGWSVGISDYHRKQLSSSKVGKQSWNKGVSPSASTREKIQKSLLGNVPWNKGLTKETDERVRQYGEKQFGKVGSNKGKKFSDEHKRKISLSHIGKKNPLTPEKREIKLVKSYITKKLNNSFNTSSTEETFYRQLLEENSEKTIYRNYKDKSRYPFYCDFYIVEDDLFIELNAHWTHGGRPFDDTDEECLQQLKEWKEKAKTSKFYENAIETWTVRDVKKLETAKKNGINYKTIY